MKSCPRCKTVKAVSEFGVRKASKDGLSVWCTACKRAHDNERYRNSPTRKSYIVASRNAARIVSQQYVWDYLAAHPCIDCQESDPRVLQFDHRDGEKKSYNISNMFTHSISAIQKEIDKCDVRCANCHARRTAIQFGWYARIKTMPE